MCFVFLAQSSVLGAGFGDLGQAKRAQANAGAQILEQLKGPGLGPLPSSQSNPPVSNQGSSSSIGRLPSLGTSVPPPSSSSWDIKPLEPNNTPLPSQFSRKCFERYRQPYTNLRLCSHIEDEIRVVCLQVNLPCSQSLLSS